MPCFREWAHNPGDRAQSRSAELNIGKRSAVELHSDGFKARIGLQTQAIPHIRRERIQFRAVCIKLSAGGGNTYGIISAGGYGKANAFGAFGQDEIGRSKILAGQRCKCLGKRAFAGQDKLFVLGLHVALRRPTVDCGGRCDIEVFVHAVVDRHAERAGHKLRRSLFIGRKAEVEDRIGRKRRFAVRRAVDERRSGLGF